MGPSTSAITTVKPVASDLYLWTGVTSVALVENILVKLDIFEKIFFQNSFSRQLATSDFGDFEFLFFLVLSMVMKLLSDLAI